MSFEGYYEFLCQNGHHAACDVYAPEPKKCRVCGASMAWQNMVDQTNGEDRQDPVTMPGKKRELGADDTWHTDHHGNKFAKAHQRYKPASPRWRALPQPPEE
jgi:hypothetical protein